jgi:adenylate kinase
VHISVGDIFRWHIQHHTKLGAQVKRVVATGELVGDDLVASVVQERLALHDWNYGFVSTASRATSPRPSSSSRATTSTA